MHRSLDVLVDADSWRSARAPVELTARLGARQVDVLRALIFTARCTRPPQVQGFHLSDCWAWHRYSHAISETADLRLREEWQSIDPHQKTILSDELGVGFTTELIQEAFGCREFTDTRHVVNVLQPGFFTLASSARAGPQKSPDYIARLETSTWLVLECKGTQSSRAALRSAITRGREQKESVETTDQAAIRHSLVAGLFIPQWESNERACISVSDPSWSELAQFLATQPADKINEAITQVTLAKELALAGLDEFPAYLVSGQARELEDLPDGARREVESLLAEEYRVVFDSLDLQSRGKGRGRFPKVVLSVSTPRSLLELLDSALKISEVISTLSSREPVVRRDLSDEFMAEVTTPIGFGFRLEVQSAG